MISCHGSGKHPAAAGPCDLSLEPAERAEIYLQLASFFQPPTWERVHRKLGKLLMQYPRFLVCANPMENIGRELDLLEKESYRYSLEIFQEEYVRLFVNSPEGVPAPPYASFYGEERLHGRATREVASFYERFGTLPGGEGGEPPDFIVYELEFLSFLCSLEPKEAQAARFQADFFRLHLAPWVEPFLDRMTRHSKLAYFQIIGAFTRGFLANEKKHLKPFAPSPS
jgi:TorA maturation chaperone TorD